MIKLFVLTLLIGCTTTQEYSHLPEKTIADPATAEWCDTSSEVKCISKEHYQDGRDCFSFIQNAAKLNDHGYWSCKWSSDSRIR